MKLRWKKIGPSFLPLPEDNDLLECIFHSSLLQHTPLMEHKERKYQIKVQKRQ